MTNTQMQVTEGDIVRVPKGTRYSRDDDREGQGLHRSRVDRVVRVAHDYGDGEIAWVQGNVWFFTDPANVELLYSDGDHHSVSYNTHVTGHSPIRGGGHAWRTRAYCSCGKRWPDSQYADNYDKEMCEDGYRSHIAELAGVDSDEVRV